MKKLLLTALSMLSIGSYAQDFKFLETITNLTAPSGFEAPVAKEVHKAWQPYLTELHQDGLGNVVGFNQKQGKATVLVMSHMDEVGFLVSKIEDNGLLRVQMLGGINDNVVMAQRYNVLTAKGNVPAYSGLEAVHIIPKEKREQIVKASQMFLDVGASSKQEVIEQFHITPGLPVAPDSRFTQLTENRFLAKALDDRIGLALMTELIQQQVKTKNKIAYAATVQEEVGLRGAKVIFKETKPDVVFNIEIGIANDFPLRLGKNYSDVGLNKGPTLFIYDSSMIPNQRLIKWIQTVAHEANIPLQLEVEPGYGEDAASLQTKGNGIATVNIGIPVRYAHQHAGIFDARDYQQALKLLKLLVTQYDNKLLM